KSLMEFFCQFKPVERLNTGHSVLENVFDFIGLQVSDKVLLMRNFFQRFILIPYLLYLVFTDEGLSGLHGYPDIFRGDRFGCKQEFYFIRIPAGCPAGTLYSL